MSNTEEMLGLPFDRKTSQLYKELEVVNFKEVSKGSETVKRGKKLLVSKFRSKSKVTPIGDSTGKKPQEQIILFQKSMKMLLIYGQCIGLNPVTGITNLDISKMKFKYFSLRYLYSVFLFGCQAGVTALCIHRFIGNSISITILAFISFFSTTTLTTFLFLRMAAKWPALMKEIIHSSLDKYVDARVQAKCNYYTAGLLATALMEHLLSQSRKITKSITSHKENGTSTIYEEFLELAFPWFTELGIPYNIPIGIILQFINSVATMNWNYSDVFIVCMCFYLASILKQINAAINNAEKRFYHPSFWCMIREDYTRATRLITSFDDLISGVMLISFASNLFFLCLQLFNMLAYGLHERGSVYGSENMVYFMFSFLFVLSRFLAVSFAAASVHDASLVPAQVLYNVPSTAYCSEVQRFLEQIHGSTVALSGLNLFYVTKGLLLTVAGTIITYELVLLQFKSTGEIKE